MAPSCNSVENISGSEPDNRDRLPLPAEWIEPLEYLAPAIHMSPYDTRFLEYNAQFLRRSGVPELDWQAHFGTGEGHWSYVVTHNGREALNFALAALELTRDDEVWIVTTSGGPYVSGCVTREVEKFCRHSRQRSANTRAVLLVHEFGYPLREIPIGLDLPVIEDCAYAFGSQDDMGRVGSYGDYVVYSLSKAFPLQFGGVLKCRRPVPYRTRLSSDAARFLLHALATYLPRSPEMFKKRRENYQWYEEMFRQFVAGAPNDELTPFFRAPGGVVPHAYVVRLADQAKAEAIKPRLRHRGIESSVFYGNGGYFLPLHQNLGRASIEYIVRNVVAAVSHVAMSATAPAPDLQSRT